MERERERDSDTLEDVEVNRNQDKMNDVRNQDSRLEKSLQMPGLGMKTTNSKGG